ncbi:hypothetical protein AVEN_256592-1 [Araneus ventricosus]|uniref:Uncharacterized protein n=1 Tax=Araneus ventricosus TaxID=182803 RepID=A0A4Y2LJE5_ARAVE|nr:hypothetical protein AVEN_256592-1 [Araneus ventricosus]
MNPIFSADATHCLNELYQGVFRGQVAKVTHSSGPMPSVRLPVFLWESVLQKMVGEAKHIQVWHQPPESSQAIYLPPFLLFVLAPTLLGWDCPTHESNSLWWFSSLEHICR